MASIQLLYVPISEILMILKTGKGTVFLQCNPWPRVAEIHEYGNCVATINFEALVYPLKS